LKNFSDPLKILTNANDILHKNLTRKNFVTAALGIIDLKNSNMIFSRAGHTPLILVRNGKANYLKPKGIGLGIANKTTFEKNIEAVEIKLEENDALILFTDGIIEARNSLGEEFGFERLISIAENYAWNNSDELRSMILKSVFAFCEGESQFDDLTLLIIKIKELNR
jgi:serine phosphatase RsbU (regulator of sigma subunit)